MTTITQHYCTVDLNYDCEFSLLMRLQIEYDILDGALAYQIADVESACIYLDSTGCKIQVADDSEAWLSFARRIAKQGEATKAKIRAACLRDYAKHGDK